MTTPIKAIVFDYGGVLLNWDPRNLYSRYFQDNPLAIDEFLSEVHFMEWNAEQDRGRPFKEGISLLTNQHPQHERLIRAYHEDWEHSIVGAIPGTVEILKRVKQRGYPVFGLSNWSAETFPIMRRKFGFFDLFDDMVISGEVGMIKPDPRIFNLLLKKIGLPADQCLLIDDSDRNIAAAGEAGFRTVHYQSSTQLENELSILGIL
jgi:2-haloacid dehalogenase